MRDRILQRLEEKKRAYAINKYGMGGMQQLKGGAMSSIPNSDAVEFIGASHEKGVRPYHRSRRRRNYGSSNYV